MLPTGPAWVAGKGLVTPPGWISPEQRAHMDRVQRQCEEDARRRAEASTDAPPQQDHRDLLIFTQN